ncbi:MAG: GntR family transcriptional regulator [Firmicutes bacterium]|nr:GntR family transcriptional regulator [Bacillota bacterium]
MMQNSKKTYSKKEIAYNRIKSMIVDGKFKKGESLVERKLCETLGVSRTPVREALHVLEKDGLVETIEGKGVFVKKIEFCDMIEIFELREALEVMAIKLFMKRADESTVKEFEKLMKEQEAAYKRDEHDKFMNIDMKLHNLISENAQNKKLRNFLNTIYDQIKQIAISAKDDVEIRDMAIVAHRKILQAILDKDSEAAQKAMLEHIIQVKKYHMERYYLL